MTVRCVRKAIPYALFALAFVASVAVHFGVFEGVPHTEDEVAFIFQAQTYESGSLYVSSPPDPEFFDLPFLVDHDGKRFGKYPPGYPLVLSLGVALGHPWLVGAVAAGLALMLLYALGRRVYGWRTSALACALGLTSPFFLVQSGTLMSHTVTLAFVALFLYSYLRTERGSRWYALLAGLALGEVFLCRSLTAVSIAVPFVVLSAYRLLRRPSENRRYLLIVLGIVPFVAAYLCYNWVVVGDATTSPYELYWAHDRIGFGLGIGSSGEHTLDLARLNTSLNLDALRATLFGWPSRLDLALVYSMFGAILLRLCSRLLPRRRSVPRGRSERTRDARRWDALLAATAICLWVGYMFYWSNGIMFGPRYYFEAMPAFLLLTARGLVLLPRYGARLIVLSRRWLPSGSETVRLLRRHRRWVFSTSTALVLVIFVGYGLIVSLPSIMGSYRGWYSVNAEMSRTADRLDLTHALVFVPRGAGWTDYATVLLHNSPRLDGEIVYALDLGPDANATLIRRYPGRQVVYWDDWTGP